MAHYLGLDWLAMCLTFRREPFAGEQEPARLVVRITGNVCSSMIGV